MQVTWATGYCRASLLTKLSPSSKMLLMLKREQALSERRPRPLIVVVDDDPAWTATIVGLLSDNGFEARGATSGSEGLRLVQSLRPDLLLLDLLLPDIDGYEVLRELGDRNVAIRVIVLSAVPVPTRAAVQTIKLGACDYVVKQEASATLIDRVHRALLLDSTLNLRLQQTSPLIKRLLSDVELLQRENEELRDRMTALRSQSIWMPALEKLVLLGASTLVVLVLYWVGLLVATSYSPLLVILIFLLLSIPLRQLKRLYAKTKSFETQLDTSSTDADGQKHS